MGELIAVLVCVGLLLSLLLIRLCQNYRFYSSVYPRISANCTGNLKQLGNTGALYASDNKGDLPGPQPMGLGLPQVSWDKPIAVQADAGISLREFYSPATTFDRDSPYRKTLVTFTCPHDLDGGAALVTTRSYSENLGDATAATGIEPTADKIPASKVTDPAGTAWLVENHPGATAFGAPNAMSDTWIDLAHVDSSYDDGYAHGHMIIIRRPFLIVLVEKKSARSNVLMHDGHVELLDKKSLSSNHPEVMKYIK
jgi:prepilin-type processing-associated H-X9-DG protein